MASFTSSDIVLVTGANGHLGSHLVGQLLASNDGPQVRACIRSEKSAEPLKETFSEYVKHGRLGFAYIADITQSGAFESALQDVTHIAHTASPLILDPEDIERDLLSPAVKGTTSLLESARNSKSLKSVVLTSSFAAVFDPFRGWAPAHIYTGSDWNPMTYEQTAGRQPCTGIDSKYEGFKLYLGSKTIAEKAAWDTYKKAKSGGATWTFSTILPTYIGGPCRVSLKGADGTDGYSFSQKKIVELAKSRGKPVPEDDFPNWIDVRDVAKAHVQALLRPEAREGRWILTSGKAQFDDISASIQKNFPSFDMHREQASTPGFSIDAQPALDALGISQWISLDEMVRDTLSPVSDRL